MKRHNCYIAGKIGGLLEEQVKLKFEQAKKEVKTMGLLPVSPLDLPHNHDKKWESYMKEDLTEMLKCNYVYALKDWRHSPGATVEINLALMVGIEIIHQK